jgi:hypothetical protein
MNGQALRGVFVDQSENAKTAFISPSGQPQSPNSVKSLRQPAETGAFAVFLPFWRLSPVVVIVAAAHLRG